MSALLVDALGYTARGFSIIPTMGKIPTIRAWKPFAKRIAKNDTLKRWFDSNKPNGVAVICGKVSGDLVCRDFDVMESYDKWAIVSVRVTASTP